ADFGVVMICDTRLVTKGYGRAFLASLPPMKRTRDLAEVTEFLRERLGGGIALNPAGPQDIV
ncbi:MAG: hypothetical protein FIB04_09265, partial [Gammaproteobacteria bacterium]|nr:hypothetical protein [Gammaproteobacteria bacterium]